MTVEKATINSDRYHMGERGIFGVNPNLEARFVRDHDTLESYIGAIRTLGMKIVLTSGTFDMLHVGHAKYLEEARHHGDVLVVGVDSDAKVRRRKGPTRPVVPEGERVQMLANLRSVDVLTLKNLNDPKWDLIKRTQPDTLIVTQETYDDETLDRVSEFCGQVIVLPPQATTSTSAKIRLLQTQWSQEIVDPIYKLLDEYDAPEELRNALGKIVLNRTS